MFNNLGDADQGLKGMQKAIRRTQPNVGGGDSDHAGSGVDSLQVGVNADAFSQDATAVGVNSSSGDTGSVGSVGSTALGSAAYARATNATALGFNSYSGNNHSTALGAGSTATADYQVMLGTPSDIVVAPGDMTVTGTFSNPSARRLKQNIVPAPVGSDVFPVLVEYEYIARPDERRVGYIADDLIGTGWERFVTFDAEGLVAGIDPIGLLMAQVAQLRAEVTALKNDRGTHG